MNRKIFSFITTFTIAVTLFIPAKESIYASQNGQLIDGKEINQGLRFSPLEDSDGDGLTNDEENEAGTSILSADTDGDRYPDSTEFKDHGTDPKRMDTDGDGLHDDVEIEIFHTDPLAKDENDNDVADGSETRTYPLPDNETGVRGTVKGIGNIPKQFAIVKNTNILIGKMENFKAFNVNSFGQDLSFTITISLPDDAIGEDPVLLHYKKGEARFTKIKKQSYDKKTNEISAATPGGSFVVVSKREYKTFKKEGKKLKKLEKQNFKTMKNNDTSIKLLDMPGFELKMGDIKDIKNNNNAHHPHVFKDAFELHDGEKSTIYQVDSFFQEESTGQYYITSSAALTENGLPPVIFIHGLASSPSGAWELNMKWENDYGHADANETISSSESYTGNTYSWAENQPYSNVDTHFIDSYQNDGDGKIEQAERLIEYDGYIPNENLFAFQYGANNHVGIAGDDLGDFINGLRENVDTISPYQDFTIIAHSKGGLVSRHYIETSTNGSEAINRLITFGTPHYGVNNSLTGDMDRANSELWGTGSDSDCEELNGENEGHFFTDYYAFSGVEDDLEDIPDSEEDQYHSISLNNNVTVTPGNSYHHWYTNKYNIEDSANGISNISGFGDGSVSIDSSLGSDLDPESPQQLSHVDMKKKWLWIGNQGGHSEFKRLYATYTRLKDILTGAYD
jgi:Palmitoyl protein thioesterase/Bacterial TSP3 repeat